MARDYLKDIKTMEDLRQRKQMIKGEVDISKRRMDKQLEELFDRTRHLFKNAILTTSINGLFSFMFKKLFGRRHQLPSLTQEDEPTTLAAAAMSSPPSNITGKLLLWAPLIKNAASLLLKLWRQRKR